MASLFGRVVATLFGTAEVAEDADRQLVLDTIDAFVDTVEPRLRQVSHYRDKLAGNVAHTLAYLRQLGTKLPHEPHVLGRAAWSLDPYVRSYFAAADDVVRCIGRCDELRDFFESHATSPDACALLGMQRKERTVLAPRMERGVLKQDVEQTTVSFGGHRLLAVAPDLAQARLEVGRRIMERLAQGVLARVVRDGEQTQDQQVHKAMLATRLRMLRSAREGMASLIEEGPSIEQQIARIERELQQLTAGQTAQGRTTLDSTIDQINGVLANPEQHVALTELTLRLDRMGVKVDRAAAGEGDTLELDELSIGEDQRATIAFVRIARDELPPKEDLLAQAQRSL